MQAAASKARSASALGTGMALASGAPPVFTEMKPPAWMMRSKAPRSTTRSLMTGKARRATARCDLVAVLEAAHVQLAGGGPLLGPCASPLIISEHMPQMPSRQSWSNAIGSSPLAISCSLSTSSISRNDMSGRRP
jgi:hypothetical protein